MENTYMIVCELICNSKFGLIFKVKLSQFRYSLQSIYIFMIIPTCTPTGGVLPLLSMLFSTHLFSVYEEGAAHGPLSMLGMRTPDNIQIGAILFAFPTLNTK